MGKKKRSLEKAKKDQKKMKQKAQKEKRQRHDPAKWEAKKAARASSRAQNNSEST